MFGELDRAWLLRFPLQKMISQLSFCFAWLTTELCQIILMRFTALRRVCLECGVAKTNKHLMQKGANYHGMHVHVRSFVLVVWGNLDCLSDYTPRRTKESTPKIGFCSNKWEISQRYWCSCCSACVWKQSFHYIRQWTSVCSQRINRKPVVRHVNAGRKANMRINWGTYHNNTWKMEQSLSLQSS